MLEADGRFDVVAETGDATRVLELVLELRPDAVLLDMAMPMATGSQAISEMRAYVPGAKVILVSGLDDTLVRDAVRASGAHELVARTASGSVLVNKLVELCAVRLDPDPPVPEVT